MLSELRKCCKQKAIFFSSSSAFYRIRISRVILYLFISLLYVCFFIIHQGVNIPQRWIFALMCFFALFNAYAMRACLSIAITEMVVPTTITEEVLDDTCPSPIVESTANHTLHQGGTFEWDEYTQVWIPNNFYTK